MRTAFLLFLIVAGAAVSNDVLAQEADQQYPQQAGQPQVQPFWTREKKPPLAPVLPPLAASTPRSSGPRESLYSEATYQSFTSDRRLHKLGDLVTVLIIEDASATSTADTGANRDAAVGVAIRNPAISKSFGVGTNNDFSGGGRTQRAGRLLGQLTVTVRDVLGNSDLMVGGEQVLEINGERQVIRLEGRVRTRDISELNTVPSSRVADAKISFAGDGVLGERQQPGWWHQLLTLFGF